MQLGLELALTGMVTVFTFLILLIFLTSLMSKTICAFEKKTLQCKSAASVVTGDVNIITDEILKTVITNAIQQHRAGRKNV